MIRYHRIYILCVALSVLLLQTVPASAASYRYIDDNGIVHFTDNPGTIPEKYQSQIKPDTEITGSQVPPESPAESPVQETPDEAYLPETGEPDKPNMSAPPAENLQEAPPETEMETETKKIPPSAETETKVDNNTPDAEIKKLIDQRKTLLEKKDTLDKKFDALIEEKKQLEAGRKNMDDEQRIQEYNKNVTRLNEKIKKFKEKEGALRLEIKNYNKSIKRPPAQ